MRNSSFESNSQRFLSSVKTLVLEVCGWVGEFVIREPAAPPDYGSLPEMPGQGDPSSSAIVPTANRVPTVRQQDGLFLPQQPGNSQIHQDLLELGFTVTHHVEGLGTILELFPKDHRCGIYVLHFRNGEYYAGQTKRVTSRYLHHCKRHDDIVLLSFKAVSEAQLDAEETAVIRALESKGYHLRNIEIVSVHSGISDFDQVLSPEMQQRWLADPTVQDLGGERVTNDELRRKYARKFRLLAARQNFHSFLEVFELYVRQCVPAPRKSELSFWACSCLPYEGNWLSRINIYKQEVFAALDDEADLMFAFQLARKPLEAAYGDGLEWLQGIESDVFAYDHVYASGGQDQCRIESIGTGATLRLLRDPVFVGAIRLFNLRLMRKGPLNNNRRYHCFDLADCLLE
jgi:hypothetical protein